MLSLKNVALSLILIVLLAFTALSVVDTIEAMDRRILENKQLIEAMQLRLDKPIELTLDINENDGFTLKKKGD